MSMYEISAVLYKTVEILSESGKCLKIARRREK